MKHNKFAILFSLLFVIFGSLTFANAQEKMRLLPETSLVLMDPG